MQEKIIDLNTEVMAVNAKVFNKVFDYNVNTSKAVGQDIIAQSEKMIGAKTVNDYIALQNEWFGKLAGQSKDAAEALYAIGTEAGQAYSELWSKYAAAAAPAVAPAVVSRKKAA